MQKLKVGVIDLVTNSSKRNLWKRAVNANFASIMPQAVAAWCEEDGYAVTYVCYTGVETLEEELPDDVDIVFISAFSLAAQVAYALSNLYRSKGAVTVLGDLMHAAIHRMP